MLSIISDTAKLYYKCSRMAFELKKLQLYKKQNGYGWIIDHDAAMNIRLNKLVWDSCFLVGILIVNSLRSLQRPMSPPPTSRATRELPLERNVADCVSAICNRPPPPDTPVAGADNSDIYVDVDGI